MAYSRLTQLTNALICQGIIPSQAERYAREQLETLKPNKETFMAMLGAMKKNAKFVNVGQAKKSGTLKKTTKEKSTIQIGTESLHYSIFTNLPRDFITPILMETFLRWMKFAQGSSSLGGQKLKHPSGRYAASLQVDQSAGNFYTIYSSSPHADVLEKGRRPFNIEWGNTPFRNGKNTKMIPIGKNSLINMGRSPLNATAVRSMKGKILPSSKVSGAAARMGQQVYNKRYNGADRVPVGKNSVWKIDSKHPMKVYSPAYHLYLLMMKSIKAAQKGL